MTPDRSDARPIAGYSPPSLVLNKYRQGQAVPELSSILDSFVWNSYPSAVAISRSAISTVAEAAKQSQADADSKVAARNAVLKTARDEGYTVRELAALTGLSHQRVHQATTGSSQTLAGLTAQSLGRFSTVRVFEFGDRIVIRVRGGQTVALQPIEVQELLIYASRFRSLVHLQRWLAETVRQRHIGSGRRLGVSAWFYGQSPKTGGK